MTHSPKPAHSLETLLKLARADADALRADLSDIARARAASESALARLDDALRSEEQAGAKIAAFDFTAYRDAMGARRRSVTATLMTLEDADAGARARLEAAAIEIGKLEYLVSLNDAALARAAAIDDRRASDEAGLRRRAF